jgi:hypothetical protein
MFFTTLFCQGLLEWRTDIQIEVFTDGSATWVVQQRTQFTTEEDEAAFFSYSNITSPVDLSNYVHSIISNASLVTGRSMRVENLEGPNVAVSSKGLSKEGTIQYQFVWLGFAERVADDRIKVGDVFSGEMDLSRDDVLTIKYPSEYASIFIYPSPDEISESERTLTWFGPRNFGAGEPHALFEKTSFSWTDVIAGNMPFLAVIVVGVSAVSLGYFLGMKRGFGNTRLKLNAGAKQTSFSELRVGDDEEKVIQLLIATGGPVYQSTITRHFSFSKSKASELLSVMERKGIVTRKKMGRGKIVTLVKEQKTNNNTKHT